MPKIIIWRIVRCPIITHQRHVCCLQGDIGSGDTHRDPDIRLRERWRIVDPIADHRHTMPLSLQASDCCDLVFREQVRCHLRNTRLPGDGTGNTCVIACQQEDTLDTCSVEFPKGYWHLRTQCIRRCKYAEQLPVVGQQQHSLAISFEVHHPLYLYCCKGDAIFRKQALCAEQERDTVHFAGDAMPWMNLDIVGRLTSKAELCCCA